MSAVIRCWCGACAGMVTYPEVADYLATHNQAGQFVLLPDSIDVRPAPHHRQPKASRGWPYPTLNHYGRELES